MRTGLTEDYLSTVERRQSVPSFSVASKAAPALNVDVAQPFSERCDASHCGQEFIFVHSGTVEFEYGDRNLILTTVDSAYFDASIGHAIYAVSIEIPEVITVASGAASPTVELSFKWPRQAGVVENPKKGQLCSQSL